MRGETRPDWDRDQDQSATSKPEAVQLLDTARLERERRGGRREVDEAPRQVPCTRQAESVPGAVLYLLLDWDRDRLHMCMHIIGMVFVLCNVQCA